MHGSVPPTSAALQAYIFPYRAVQRQSANSATRCRYLCSYTNMTRRFRLAKRSCLQTASKLPGSKVHPFSGAAGPQRLLVIDLGYIPTTSVHFLVAKDRQVERLPPRSQKRACKKQPMFSPISVTQQAGRSLPSPSCVQVSTEYHLYLGRCMPEAESSQAVRFRALASPAITLGRSRRFARLACSDGPRERGALTGLPARGEHLVRDAPRETITPHRWQMPPFVRSCLHTARFPRWKNQQGEPDWYLLGCPGIWTTLGQSSR